MANNKIEEKKFPSVVEWLDQIKIPGIKGIKTEDFTKRARLQLLNKIIHLPYLKASIIPPCEIEDFNNKIRIITNGKTKTTYLLKLLPTNSTLKKIRIQIGANKIAAWIKKRKINTRNYHYELIKQPNKITHSAIFCIDEKGIWGELINDHIIYFSQGNYVGKNTIFYYDFKKWHFSNNDHKATKLIKKAIKKLRISNNAKRQQLGNALRVEFIKSNHLKGYFEFIVDKKSGINFVDYNRILNKLLRKTIITITKHTDYLHGICIGPGKAKGKIRKVKYGTEKVNFHKGDILVSPLITFQHLPLIKKSGGIITEQSTVLSHAAIVSRELKKPYVANVKDAMKKLKDGDLVTVDANNGKIIIH